VVRQISPKLKKVLYGIAAGLFLLLLVGLFAPMPEMEKRQWAGSGVGDSYDYEFKCPDPSASIWKLSISVELRERGGGDLPDFLSVAILHYTGEPSALDEGWHVYPDALDYTEGDYAEVTLEVELDPSKTYRLAVETDPELSWSVQVMEEWR
jgi:hypothetical protein